MSASATRDHGPDHVLRDALRGYLAEHPDAADGLVGIRLWWLPEPLRGVSFEQLHRALSDLVDVGEMRCTTMLDGTELYARSDAMDPPSPADETG